MKYRKFVISPLLALAAIVGPELRADNMASIAITPATGAVTLSPQWSIGGSLAGFHLMSQDLSLGGGANQFYSVKGTTIPSGGDISAFTRYIAASGAATNHVDIGSKLTPNSYSALTSADPDVGYGSVNFYFIHHKASGDYFTVLKPSSGVASAVTDLKPMSGPGGPATLGASGYFGLTFSAANLGYGLNNFYYLRTDPVSSRTKFGTLDPALLGTSADKFDLGTGGYNALAFTGTDVGFGTDKMYYLRLDPITGFTILGTLHPATGRVSDIANLGSVYSTLTFVPGDVGFGVSRFYTTGAVNPTWQSVSFAAITDRAISGGSFTVAPSASSALPIALTVVPGSTGAASISGPIGGVFTITPTAPGVLTLQATQAGQSAPTAYEYNMLRQSFTITGTATLAISAQPTSQSAALGSAANLSVTAGGTSALTYQWRKAGANIVGNASATTATLTLPNVQAGDSASYDVVVTNASGTIVSDPVTLTVTTAAPVITNLPLSVGGTVGSPFSFSITASGAASYTASPLPAGLSIVGATGAITGTPTTPGVTSVLLGARNGSGTGNATLTITVSPAGSAPIIINNQLTAAGTTGVPFSYSITASGSPTSYAVTGLPAGLTLNAVTGAINGTPTTAGVSIVTLTASNSTGISTATLTIDVAAAPYSRIVDFSARAISGPGNQTLIMGFVVSGDNKNLLVRGIGPGLAAFGVTAPLQDPVLTLFGPNGVAMAGNDDWQTPASGQASGTLIAATAAQVGAFALPTGSKDSALIAAFNNGAHTTSMIRPNSGTGVALTEIYDIDTTTTSRLVNVSARMNVVPGEGTLIAGLVIAGNIPKTVLIRGVGPTLSAFAVTGVLADPRLTVYSGRTEIATNDNWEAGTTSAAQLVATSIRVGAFALTAGSRDAALVITLQPGNYTVHLTGVADTAGVALVEVYDMQ